MSVFDSILGRRPSRERPDLAAWLGGASPVLVMDGDGSCAALQAARVLRHETAGGPGLPFHYPDPRRLPARDGEFAAVVLAGVLDQVIDAGSAIDEARRVIDRGGLLLIVQSVAPDDFEQRAIWNAIARMREPRHASTCSGRQFAALVSGCGMEVLREAAWEESADPTQTSRPETARHLALMVGAAVAHGAAEVVREGVLVVSRRASLLRRS